MAACIMQAAIFYAFTLRFGAPQGMMLIIQQK